MQGIVIAGTHSGCGKTTITLGIMAALGKKGLTVQPFKAGPDFIDTGLHGLITGRRSRNLDLWMCGEEYVKTTFAEYSAKADIAVVEGVMGMYDGEFSTARLASVLGLPVILVVDAYGMAESAGAVVTGFIEFGAELRETNSRFKIQDSRLLTCMPSGRALDSKLQFAGVIFNRVGSERHYKRLKDSIKGVPVSGYLPRDLNFKIPHRHLGLHVAEEAPFSQDETDRLADYVLEYMDVDMIIENSKFKIQNSKLKTQNSKFKPCLTAGEVQDLTFTKEECRGLNHDLPDGQTGPKLRIAVARDRAFCFYYEDNLDMLRAAGAVIIEFSPLAGSSLPEGIDALYLGGGYPELYAKELSRNTMMLDSIRSFSMNGNPVYAECGGFMYLTQGIYDFDEIFYPMAGVFPFKTAMKKGRANLGFREIELQDICLLGDMGDLLRGHEFHYSEIKDRGQRPGISGQEAAEGDQAFDMVYTTRDGAGNPVKGEGYRVRNTLGSYIHLHFGSNTDTIKHIIEEIIKHKSMNEIPAKAGIHGDTNRLDSASSAE